jgi:predicted nucleic acid-binding protein
VTILPDTSVWSLLLRRDAPSGDPRVAALERGLLGGERVATTGPILQELLQGFARPSAREQIIESFGALEMIQPTTADHLEAAGLRDTCRRAGVPLGTVDALIAALCVRRDLVLLTADEDFTGAAKHCALRLWGG